jgi:two-component system sensor histidine kinase VanS
MYLAHDIKTPLTSVIGYLSLLEEDPDMPLEQKAKYVNITLKKALKLEELVDEFFEITRLNFQVGLLSKQAIDLHYLLLQMVDEFYPLLCERGMQAVIHASENLTIFGDPNQLARVFNNVLRNAVAYSPENSDVVIGATITDSSTVITFTNEGSIPEEDQALIFEKFYRRDSARSSHTGGSGLGLSIAKAIVLAHGGQIYVDCQGNKTIFTVLLPQGSLH